MDTRILNIAPIQIDELRAVGLVVALSRVSRERQRKYKRHEGQDKAFHVVTNADQAAQRLATM